MRVQVACEGMKLADEAWECMCPLLVETHSSHVRMMVFGTYRDMMEEREECGRVLYSDLEHM